MNLVILSRMFTGLFESIQTGEIKPTGIPAFINLAIQSSKQKKITWIVSCKTTIESEIAQLAEEDKEVFLTDLGLTESGLDRVIHAGQELLGLQTFFTAGVKEVRAWTVKNGARAPQAAGVIHTDFERGFICADVIAYDDYIKCNGESGARDTGKLRLEGKSYVMQDGDVVHFKFNV